MNKSKHRKDRRRKQAGPDAGRRKTASPDAGHPVKPGISALDRLAWPPPVVVAALLLLTGAVLRLLYLGEIPAGLWTDEASVGYEAWSLLHHGITRNGYAWPVHFVAWGNGQSALYSYLSLPIIAALDLTVVSNRLLMALTGTASLLLFWRIAAHGQSSPPVASGVPGACFALLALLLLALCPWHVMLSRWALDANLLPFVVLFSVYFFSRPDNHRLGIQAAGVFVLSLSVYAYSAAYAFAPLFLALVFGWLRVQGKLPLRHFLPLSALSLLTVLPILLYLAVNFFDWEAIRAGISMPKFTGEARYEQKSILFGGRFLSLFVDQLLVVAKLLTTSDVPAHHFNKMARFAVLFPFAIVPLAAGFGVTIYRAVTRREFGVHLLMALWFIAAFATVSITIVNINRANVLWLPALYFAALGVFYACRQWRALLAVAAVAYLVYGGLFAHTYFTHYNDRQEAGIVPPDRLDFLDLQPAIAGAVESAGPDDKIYIGYWVRYAYIYVLFHTKIPPQDYLNTRTFEDPHMPFQIVTSFDRFIFDPKRVGEADHLIMRTEPTDTGYRIVQHPDEAEILDAAMAKCPHERHGHFVVLHLHCT